MEKILVDCHVASLLCHPEERSLCHPEERSLCHPEEGRSPDVRISKTTLQTTKYTKQ